MIRCQIWILIYDQLTRIWFFVSKQLNWGISPIFSSVSQAVLYFHWKWWRWYGRWSRTLNSENWPNWTRVIDPFHSHASRSTRAWWRVGTTKQVCWCLWGGQRKISDSPSCVWAVWGWYFACKRAAALQISPAGGFSEKRESCTLEKTIGWRWHCGSVFSAPATKTKLN